MCLEVEKIHILQTCCNVLELGRCSRDVSPVLTRSFTIYCWVNWTIRCKRKTPWVLHCAPWRLQQLVLESQQQSSITGPLWGESIGNRLFPLKKVQLCRKGFHITTPAWNNWAFPWQYHGTDGFISWQVNISDMVLIRFCRHALAQNQIKTCHSARLSDQLPFQHV